MLEAVEGLDPLDERRALLQAQNRDPPSRRECERLVRALGLEPRVRVGAAKRRLDQRLGASWAGERQPRATGATAGGVSPVMDLERDRRLTGE